MKEPTNDVSRARTPIAAVALAAAGVAALVPAVLLADGGGSNDAMETT
jgi:hypothetical protein